MKFFLSTLFLLPFLAFAQKGEESIWDLKALYKAPEFEETTLKSKPNVKSIFYKSINYEGQPTKVYAYYGLPKTEKPKNGYPAIVLIHGGGGTAMEEWVEIWNKKGYAAISMDLEGHLPSFHHKDRVGFEGNGPSRVGVFHDNDKPLKDQWYYQAVAQVIIANSFLRNLDDVDANKIGVTGVSWGGMLTSTVAGVDHRFKFAIPIYGCGFLNGTDGHMGNHFRNGNDAYRENLLKNFEGQKYLPKAEMPILFINGSNDAHFPIPASVASYKAPKSDAYLYIVDGLGHGHPPAWKVPESYTFADAIVNNKPFMKIQKTQWDNGIITASVKSADIANVMVYYTEDTGKWGDRKWTKLPAKFSGKKIKGELPSTAQAAYFLVTDTNGITLTSEVKMKELEN
ncbi:alpha/beta hydrolase family protein [Flammeovirga agarivorans]|uniref:Prolyl oligopeptidase family serine peptidase n=1 Tax=Flammeovirga agarivorans TaxID=2726742 RepID=A0A7X8XXQ6_9BACT|nr:acetylxylan esterase [Flammeovirga agarivorans]NLR93320.1 prolyl oligopeptidase family serine peptidase [Flammeovirga agarivorans]